MESGLGVQGVSHLVKDNYEDNYVTAQNKKFGQSAVISSCVLTVRIDFSTLHAGTLNPAG